MDAFAARTRLVVSAVLAVALGAPARPEYVRHGRRRGRRERRVDAQRCVVGSAFRYACTRA
jgi:hypothetical protein